ncbi:MAG: MotA/TolQ/ExbB proton channel family protein [Porticoccaceae bacterium]
MELIALELITLGGPVVVVLLALSALGLAVFLFKLVQYRSYSNAMFDRVGQVLQSWVRGDAVETLRLASVKSTPYTELLQQGMEWLGSGQESEQVREELTRQGQSAMAKITSMNGFIEQIAYLAPLFGLLGTVLGMIDVFQGLASATAGTETGALAGGIWEALLTTAVGLTVAIPFALMHAGLEGRANKIRKRMEDQMTQLFTADLYQSSSSSTR